MARESVEIDGDLAELVMRLHGLPSKSAAADLALRRLVVPPDDRPVPLRSSEALALRGSGWTVRPTAGDPDRRPPA